MKAFSLLLGLCAVFSAPSGVNAADSGQPKEHHEFKTTSNGMRSKYLKVEASGCATIIYMRPDRPSLTIGNDIACRMAMDKSGSTREIAESTADIIEHFNLANAIRSKTTVYFSIGWRINDEPIIRAINDDSTWPLNIYTYLDERFLDTRDKYYSLLEKLRHLISRSRSFGPFAAVMSSIGCSMTLKERFVDAIIFDKHKMTKEMLIEEGVFTGEEARKDEYPVFRGPIGFDLTCDEQNRKQRMP